MYTVSKYDSAKASAYMILKVIVEQNNSFIVLFYNHMTYRLKVILPLSIYHNLIHDILNFFVVALLSFVLCFHELKLGASKKFYMRQQSTYFFSWYPTKIMLLEWEESINTVSLCFQCQLPEVAVGSGEEQPLLSVPPWRYLNVDV